MHPLQAKISINRGNIEDKNDEMPGLDLKIKFPILYETRINCEIKIAKDTTIMEVYIHF